MEESTHKHSEKKWIAKTFDQKYMFNKNGVAVKSAVSFFFMYFLYFIKRFQYIYYMHIRKISSFNNSSFRIIVVIVTA